MRDNLMFVRDGGGGTDHGLFDGVDFKALGSTEHWDAICNTRTHWFSYQCHDLGKADDAAIYWYGGERVADSYRDFYDGSWASHAPTNQDGDATSGLVATGSLSDGSGNEGHLLDAATVTVGDPTTPTAEIHDVNISNSSSPRYYALSEVLRTNARPIADAGPELSVFEGDTHWRLNGFGSHDPDGYPLTYEWNVHPDIGLSDPHIVNPKLVIPYVSETTYYGVSLTVTDSHGLSSTSHRLLWVIDRGPPDPSPDDPVQGASGAGLEVLWEKERPKRQRQHQDQTERQRRHRVHHQCVLPGGLRRPSGQPHLHPLAPIH